MARNSINHDTNLRFINTYKEIHKRVELKVQVELIGMCVLFYKQGSPVFKISLDALQFLK